ncbi:TolC family protein [Alteromonas sp. ASW11-130]|uniref:TolC family protein n=1 Tax=Alteromonas sp. ASW11-130 TaxID=3015775 RepID=UPI0022425D11|nr:TolC family protein [Alteromonas sp. ASW11-130]MCW8091140.1 TolC family protein [Alteromonas sp. ASW11-130]
MSIFKNALTTWYSMGVIFICGTFSTSAISSENTLSNVIALAIAQDPWLQGKRYEEQALKEESIAADTLPNPNVSINMMNLPVDTFSFDQEAMTQLMVGVSQPFPRGDTLSLKREQLDLKASQLPVLRQERIAAIKTMVTQRWLEWYQAQQTLNLIEADSALFEQMADIVSANYSSAFGNTGQQDVVRAHLELIQLEDRLTVQRQQRDVALAALNEWVAGIALSQSLPESLPEVTLHNPDLLDRKNKHSLLVEALNDHPSIRAIDVEQQVAGKNIELARQQYKPQWGINASYAYRDDSSAMERADFLSIGVTFDVPLFQGERQDRQVSASIARSEAVKTNKRLKLRTMLAQVQQGIAQLRNLQKRQALYNDQLLNQTAEQAELTLTAYTNDNGDFSEVVMARIAQLNTRIAALNIDIEILKVKNQLNFFFPNKIEHHVMQESQYE